MKQSITEAVDNETMETLWVVGIDYDEGCIHDGNNLIICEAPDKSMYVASYKGWKANAALIVKAVNNHAQLLKALKELRNAEWMVTHDWGGNRTELLNSVDEVLKQVEES